MDINPFSQTKKLIPIQREEQKKNSNSQPLSNNITSYFIQFISQEEQEQHTNKHQLYVLGKNSTTKSRRGRGKLLKRDKILLYMTWNPFSMSIVLFKTFKCLNCLFMYERGERGLTLAMWGWQCVRARYWGRRVAIVNFDIENWLWTRWKSEQSDENSLKVFSFLSTLKVEKDECFIHFFE